MASGIKISQLNPATTLDGTESLPVVQNGVTVKATTNQIKTLSQTSVPAANVVGTLSSATIPGSNVTGTITTATIPGANVSGALTGATIDAGSVTGTLPINHGGTGQTTANAAFNALAPSQASNSGKYLTTDGSNTSWGSISTGLTVSTTPISGGNAGRILYENATNKLGEGNLAYSTTYNYGINPDALLIGSALNSGLCSTGDSNVYIFGIAGGLGVLKWVRYFDNQNNSGVISTGYGFSPSFNADNTSAASAFLRYGGSANTIVIGNGDSASPSPQTLGVQNVATGTADTSGISLTIQGSQGTGTGVGGDIVFKTAPAGSSGSTQNALSTALTIKGDGSTQVSGSLSGTSIGLTSGSTIYNATAIPAGGTAGTGYKFSSTANFGVFFGSGAPTLSAAQGSLYVRSDGAPYYNNNGTTGWTQIGAGITAANDSSTASDLYPLFAASATGTIQNVYTDNGDLNFKPSTGELKARVPVANNGIFVNSQTVSTDYTIASGFSGMSSGPVTVASGKSVTVSSGSKWVVL